MKPSTLLLVFQLQQSCSGSLSVRTPACFSVLNATRDSPPARGGPQWKVIKGMWCHWKVICDMKITLTNRTLNTALQQPWWRSDCKCIPWDEKNCVFVILFSLMNANLKSSKVPGVTLKNNTLQNWNEKLYQGANMALENGKGQPLLYLLCPLIYFHLLTGCVWLFRDQRGETPVSGRTLCKNTASSTLIQLSVFVMRPSQNSNADGAVALQQREEEREPD